MRLLLLAASAVAAIAASPALAVTPSISFTQGSYALTNPNATVVQSFNGAVAGGTQYTPAANETTTGDVRVYSTTVPGLGVDPDGVAGNNYLAVGNGSYGISFSGAPVQYFSFVLGSLDSYNTLRLTFADGSVNTYAGQQIVGAASAGPRNSGTAGRVVYDFGGQSGLTNATFLSSDSAFEIDAIATAVPEPTTWAMAMVGFGLVGGSLRSRRTRKVAVQAA